MKDITTYHAPRSHCYALHRCSSRDRFPEGGVTSTVAAGTAGRVRQVENRRRVGAMRAGPFLGATASYQDHGRETNRTVPRALCPLPPHVQRVPSPEACSHAVASPSPRVSSTLSMPSRTGKVSFERILSSWRSSFLFDVAAWRLRFTLCPPNMIPRPRPRPPCDQSGLVCGLHLYLCPRGLP